jgi:predicted P-loop ATPase
MIQATETETFTQQRTPTMPSTAIQSPEPTWWQKDLAASGITEEILKKMGAYAPYAESDPDTMWFGILNNADADECGPIPARDLGEGLVFPFPHETFQGDSFDLGAGPRRFARVKPQRPRLVGEYLEWIDCADGTRRKLTGAERKQLRAAEAWDPTSPGSPCPGPRGYNSKDNRKPVKYESPRGVGQRLYDVIKLFHPEGLGAHECLHLIEGEKKAICANANLGLKAYGLPGVTGAHDVDATYAAMDAGTGTYVLHAKIEHHCRRGSKVATLFDSPDVGKNAQVAIAQARILRAVQKAGGKPEITFIPDDLEHGKKRGIDDFFVERGVGAIKSLVTLSALPFQALQEYEDRVTAETRHQLPRCLCLHAGAWFSNDRVSLKKWVRKATKVFDVDEEQVMEWCNQTARIYQETSQQRTIRELEHHHELLLGKGELRMDERTQEIYQGETLLRPDSAVTAVRANLSLVPNRLGPEPTREDVRDAIRHIAERNQFHPVREYLDGLNLWDGTSRMTNAIDHLGVASGARHPLQKTLFKKFLISAVARCYAPGCKVDTMLILQGPQGVGKSSVFKALCADPSWFTDQGFDVNDKDAVLIISRNWLVEWAELDNLKRASRREVLKSFVTRRVDSVRPPYARSVVDLKRSCVFCGTTNDDTFLEDATGHRRFWIISDVGKVDVDWFEENRDQLFAEALAAYRAGEKWWLDDAEDEVLKELQRRHEVPSRWAEVVEDYLTTGKSVSWGGTSEDWNGIGKTQPPAFVTLSEVLEKAVGKAKSQQTKSDHLEVADILKSLGWVKGSSRSRANGRTPIWRRANATQAVGVVDVQTGSTELSLDSTPANCNGVPPVGNVEPSASACSGGYTEGAAGEAVGLE